MILAPGRLEPRRRCQHCDRDIRPVAGDMWEDDDGFTVCIKNTSALPLGPDGYVMHTPLPKVT